MTLLLPEKISITLEELDFSLSKEHPLPEISALLNETVLFGGKKLRPLLCLLMGGAFGLDCKKVAPFARIAEFTHAASLAHDDIIDEAGMRRQRETINAMASNAKAVLAGDYLLSRALDELSGLGNLQLVQDLARVFKGLVNGEWMQLGIRGNVDVTFETLEMIADFKTAGLIGWCCMVPARITNCSEETVKTCTRFGRYFGQAFQMVDDVIDYEIQGEKGFAQDLRCGLVNFVTLEMIIADRSLPTTMVAAGASVSAEPMAKKLANILKKYNVKSKIEEWPWTEEQLAEAKARVRQKAVKHIDSARTELSKIAGFSSSFASGDEFSRLCILALESILALTTNRVT
ncbi:MAG: polyprenyl synthetase family protein [Bdellovibrionota bacterium]